MVSVKKTWYVPWKLSPSKISVILENKFYSNKLYSDFSEQTLFHYLN